MFSVEEWHELERSKDLVLNTFDLISFILVTPELIRLVKPTFKPFVFLLFMFLGAFPALLMGYSMYVWFDELEKNLWIAIPAYVTFVLLRDLNTSKKFGTWLGTWLEEHYPPTLEWMTKHAFVLGACLFFVARLYGVLLSAHEVFGSPN